MSHSSLRQIGIAFLVLAAAAMAMPAAALDFYTVPPCRVFDSRTDSTHQPPDNPLQAGVTYKLAVAGACGVPAGANAVSLNATVIGPTGLGNLVIFAAGTAAPVGGMQFHPGQTKAMFQMVSLGTGGDAGKLSFLASISPPPATPNYKLTLDITGYFLNQAPTDIALDNSTVAEGQPAGTLVGNLSTTDPDPGDTHTYSLVTGTGDTDNASFQISGSQLQTAAVLDFETQSSYSVRIRTTDSGGLFFEKVFTITATGANEAPTDIALSPSTVAENQPSGTAVGTFSTTDPDAGDTHTYTLVAGTGDTDNASFAIVGNQLQTAASLDFEAQPSYSIRVRSTDAGSLFFEKVFTITATNVNEAPTDIALSPSTVNENQPVGTTVGTFSTTDPDAGDTFTYTLVAGAGSTDNGSFAIVGNQLQTAAVFDLETQSSYSIRVRSTDAGGLFFEKIFTITVTNVNEAPTDIALSPSAVDENQAAGTVVGTFSTTDPDAGDTFTYTLVTGTGDTDNASFAIVGNQLQTAAVFDFEVKNSYSIRVRSTDAGSLFFEKVFTITVNNVNEAPTDIALDNATLAENQPSGTAVGNFSTTDPDAGDTFTYTLVAGAGSTDNGSFAIVGNQLRTAAVLDFETKSSYSIRVRSTDAGGLFFEKVFTITLTNVNEAPTDIALSPTSVNEAQPSGTTVGTFSTTDPDAGDSHTYTLVAGTGSTDNGSFAIVGNQLQTAAVFDFETKSSYSIRVRSTDAGGLFFEKVFTITVNNINEAPTDIALSNASVNENQPINTPVGNFSTTDPDVGDTFTYTLVAGTGDDDNGSFTIVGNQLRTNAVFDRETKSSYSIRVRSTDSGSLFFEKVFTITINNVNETPTDIALSPTAVNENQPVGTGVGNFSTTDPDVGDTFTYTLVAGVGSTDNGSFTIVGNQLRTAAVFNYEVKNSYSIRVRSTDAGGLSTEKVFTITVLDIPEPPVAATDNYETIANTRLEVRNVPSATGPKVVVVGDVMDNDSDEDAGSTLSVVAASGATTKGGSFSILADGTFTYEPEAGDIHGVGTEDTFTYTLTDGTFNVLGTVSLKTVGRVWYVKNDAPALGTGRSNDPFDTLLEADTASAAGDTIYVYFGDGATTGQNVGIALKANQRLIGEGVQLDVPVSVNGGPNPTVLRAAGSQPLLDRVGGTGECVRLNNVGGVEIRGLSLGGDANAIDITTTGGNSGGATIRNNTFRRAGAEGIDVNAGGSGAMTLDIQTNTWNVAGTHTGNAVDLARTAGTMQVAFNSNTNILSAANAVNISGGAFASTTITSFSGNSVHGNTGLAGIVISQATFDSNTGTAGFQQVDGDNLVIGASANVVGGLGMSLLSVQGNLFFDDLDIYANTSGLTVSGAGGGMTFAVTPAFPAGSGTSVILANGGAAVDVTSVTLNLQLDDMDSTTTGAGVNLSSVAGTFSTDSDASIAKSSGGGTAFSVANGSVAVDYAGTLNVTSGGGVSLTSNTGVANFSGQLTLKTGANAGFSATGGGTVTATGSGNSIKTTSGSALTVSGTTIGAAGLNFVCISAGRGDAGVGGGPGCTQGDASGTPANGIFLSSTGAGVLTVNGDGSNTSLGGNSSGGMIQNTTGSTGSTGGIGVYVNNARATLRRMNIHDHSNYGIFGGGSTVFNLEYSTVNSTATATSTNGDAASADDEEGSVAFEEWAGSGTITSSIIGDGFSNNLRVLNTNGADLNRLTVSNSRFDLNGQTAGNDQVHIESRNSGTTLNFTLTGSTVKGARADWFNASANSSSTMDTVITGNTFTNVSPDNHPATVANGNRILITANATHTFEVANNTLKGSLGNALAVTGAAGGAVLTGDITNNDIGDAAIANSGSTGAGGISVQSGAGADITILINGNDVRQYNNHGIIFTLGDQMGNAATINATVTNNTANTPGTLLTDFNGFHVNSGTVSTDNLTSCLNIHDNNFTGGGKGAVAPNNSDVRLRQRQGTTIQLPGYTGPARDNGDLDVAEVITYLRPAGSGGLKNNTFGTGNANSVSTGGGYVNSPGGAACPTPP